MDPAPRPQELAFVYRIFTWLPIHPAPPFQVRKIGCHRDLSFPDAEATLRGRYRTDFGSNADLRAIFVGQPTRQAEDRLKELLRPYHLTNELYACADTAELDAAIAAAFEELSVPEADAYRTDVSDKKLARLEKDLEAQEAFRRELLARKAEEQRLALDRERIGADEAAKKRKALEDERIAAEAREEAKRATPLEWIAANVIKHPNAYVELYKLWADFRASLPLAQRKKHNAGLFKEKAHDFMVAGGGIHVSSTTINGKTVDNAVRGYERVL